MPEREYDHAYFDRMLGVFYWQNGQMKPALAALTQAVNSGQLVDDQAWSTRRMLADLLLMNKEYKLALPHYYELTKSLPKDQKGDDIWLRIGQTHYQLGEWQPVLKAMKNTKPTDYKTKPTLYRLNWVHNCNWNSGLRRFLL